MTYVAFSITIALIFLVAATLTGYNAVARFGGVIWVFMLSMIVTMPIVTSRFKRARGPSRHEGKGPPPPLHDDVERGPLR